MSPSPIRSGAPFGPSTSSIPSPPIAASDHYHLANTSQTSDQHPHIRTSEPPSSTFASSSRHTLDQGDNTNRTSKPAASSSSTRPPTSASSPPSSPASAAAIDDRELESQSLSAHFPLRGSQEGLHSSIVSNRSTHSDHPNTSGMATLTVNTPPAVHQSDPMLSVRSTNSPLHESTASFHPSHRSPSPPPPPAPYAQPPVTSSLSNVTSGDGWAIVPKSPRCTSSTSEAAVASAVASSSASASSTSQHAKADDFAGLSQAAYAAAANDASNRRCGPVDLAPSYDVPFGERASPAIISLAQRNARPLSRNGAHPPSPLTLSPALASEPINPSGAHRGGLRGSDEDLEVADKDAAMDTSDDNCAPTGATPLVPPATRKLCVRHQRMADEGTTARLQKVSDQFRFDVPLSPAFFSLASPSFITLWLPACSLVKESARSCKVDADPAASCCPLFLAGARSCPAIVREGLPPLAFVDR